MGYEGIAMTDRLQNSAVIPLEGKMRDKRRGPRMNSQVPVALEWQDRARGEECHVQARTRVVNFYGCLLIAARPMAIEQKLVLTNLATERSIGGVVVYRGKKGLDGWEMGVELVNPDMDFWGVDL
jgi:hypothetical protein